MARSAAIAKTDDGNVRSTRLGFRVHEGTKSLVEKAAALERRTVTDFCLMTLAAAAQETIARHESLALSERDRVAFFDALMHPPKPNARLRRAFREAGDRVTR